MKEKLEAKLEDTEMKQTRNKRDKTRKGEEWTKKSRANSGKSYRKLVIIYKDNYPTTPITLKAEILMLTLQYVWNLNLKNLSDDLKKDREIVLTAVKNDGFAIADANSNFLDDKEIAIEAVKNNKHTLLLLSKRLTEDKDIIDLVEKKQT